MKKAVEIVWFKRDLRTRDHQPLLQASQSDLPVIPLFIVEPKYWRQPFASQRHWQFIHDCLTELRQDCALLGQPLVVKIGEILAVLDQLEQQYRINTIYAHEENGNGWTYQRDKAVIAWCNAHHIALVESPSNGVVRRLKSRDDWAKVRKLRLSEPIFSKPEKLLPVPEIEVGEIPSKTDPLFGEPFGDTQAGGRRHGIQMLKSFLSERHHRYLFHISSPRKSADTCSRLSPYIAWGCLSIKEIVTAVTNYRTTLSEDQRKASAKQLNAFNARLAWRCHFVQKIEDQPAIEFECMHPAFEGMRKTETNDAYFTAWKTGQTGYPLVDACMRELIATGWITFRMRAMLVSFASYHLWLDWRKTGEYLAQLFTDYEPGIHYSQLQMQSGVTGINTLRIYNPIKQSEKQDPNGEYIKRWVPELRNVSPQWIHQPWLMSDTLQKSMSCQIGTDYPLPIIHHATAITAARAKISKRRKQAGFNQESKKVYNKLGSRKNTSKPKSITKKQKTNKQMNLF